MSTLGKWENKLSHCAYSASRLVYQVPGPISPGYSLFAPLALRKTGPHSLTIERLPVGYVPNKCRKDRGCCSNQPERCTEKHCHSYRAQRCKPPKRSY